MNNISMKTISKIPALATRAAVSLLLTLTLFGSASEALDPVSIECLSCHDAALATDSTVLTVCAEPGCDHPFGVDYVYLSSRNLGLRSPFMLDPALQLAGGSAIGCGTCHVPYSSLNHTSLSNLRSLYPRQADPMLSMDNRGSRLCLGCHDK